jgi:hypothetical protein
MSTSSIIVNGGVAEVQFGTFDLGNYELFLRAKKLPESQLFYDEESDCFTLKTAARYAAQLGVTAEGDCATHAAYPISDYLFDYQKFASAEAIEAKRYAMFFDCGLGKTPMELEFAHQVLARTSSADGLTGPRVLISTLPDAIPQFYEMLRDFYHHGRMEHLDTRAGLIEWCKSGSGLGITNHHKFIEGVIPELRLVNGFVLDESSILKTGGGVIKWNLSKSAKGVEYKLSGTATPAPNDIMEYASQAGFLERIRHEGEVLWTFFSRKGKEGVWEIKQHALEPFYRFMASWSIYMRNPAAYGFRDNLRAIPEPVFEAKPIQVLPEQMAEAAPYFAQAKKGGVFGRLGVVPRLKLSQIAKGFVYEKAPTEKAPTATAVGSASYGTNEAVALPMPKRKAKAKANTVRRIASAKPDVVIEIAAREFLCNDNQVLVWTVFDEESAILFETLKDLSGACVGILTGETKPAERARIIAEYKRGEIDILISKASLLGFALNLQNTGAMVFSGWDDSYERLYQAIRRAVRYGQTKSVRIHLPFIPELEGMTYDNLMEKQANFEKDAALQEKFYLQAYGERLAAFQQGNTEKTA